MKKMFVIALLLGVMTTVSAEDTWQYDVSLHGSSSSSDGYDSHALGGNAKYYYAPLPVEADYPLAEAMYMERIGYVEGSYDRADFDGSLMSGDMSLYQVGTVYMQPGSNILAGLYVNKSDSNSQFMFGTEPAKSTNDTHSYNGGLGYFLQENLLAAVSYSYGRTDSSYNTIFPSPLIFPPTTSEYRTVGLSLRYWSRMGNSFVVLEPGYDYTTSASTYSSDGKNISAGMRGLIYWSKYQDVWLNYSATVANDNYSGGKLYSTGYDVFLTRSLYLNLMYVFTKADQCPGGCISRIWSATAGMRF